ncbi:MAG: HEAT repeat domain-containing protein [Chloroflexi bacterium]|nr:HEAT repeat domain-containing protein [Chloroflexota bacterium]
MELLIALLQDQELRRAAIFGLGHMGDARAVEPLIAVLRDADSIVREFAARALGQIGDARAVEPLIVALEDNAATVVEAATMALNSLGVPRGVQAARDAFLQRQEQASQTQQRRVDATEQVVTELCALLRSEKGSDFPHESTIQRARAIGEQLNQHGGFERMQRVMKVVIDQMPFDYQRLDYLWDGIGQWRW